MDDRMRASDADRDQATARLREHFAAGRLTQAELDERITAALSAKTLGDLRQVTVDLPEPGMTPWAATGPRPQRAGPPFVLARHRGPRLLPVLLLELLWLSGHDQARRAAWRALSDQAIASGNPALDYVGTGGPTPLRTQA